MKRVEGRPGGRVVRKAIKAVLEALEPRKYFAVTITSDSSFTTLQNDVIAFKIARTEGTTYSRGDITSIRIKETNKELLQPGQRLFLEIGVGEDASSTASGVGESATTTYSPFSSDDGPVFSITADTSTDPSWGAVRLYRRTGTNLSMLVSQYYVLRDGEAGLHSFTSFMGQTPTGAERLDFARLRMNLSDSLFRQWSVEDNRSGTLPTSAQMVAAQWSDPNYKEAPIQISPGNFYSKYEAAAYYHDTDAVGLFGTDGTMDYSAFYVNPNQEANTGGYNRHELTVHATTYGPIVLGMMHARHYGAPGIALSMNERRAFAPQYLAFNYGPAATTTLEGLRNEAEAMVSGLIEGNNTFYKTVMANFSDTWSYLPFETSARGRVQGRFITFENRSMSNATIVLGDPNTDSQLTNQGYQYYTRTDSGGYFDMKNVRPGTYRMTIRRDGDFGEFRIENFRVTANTTFGGGNSAANTWFVTSEGLRMYTNYNSVVASGSFSYGGSNYGDFGTDVFRIGTPDGTGSEFQFGDMRSASQLPQGGNYAYRRSVHLIAEDVRTAYPSGPRFAPGSSAATVPFVHWAQIGDLVPVAPYSTQTPSGTSTYTFDIAFDLASKPVAGQLATLSVALASVDTSRLAARVYDATGTLRQTLYIYPYTTEPSLGTRVRDSSAAFRQGISGIGAIGLTQAGLPVQFDATRLSAGRNVISISLEGSAPAKLRNVIYDALKLELSDVPAQRTLTMTAPGTPPTTFTAAVVAPTGGEDQLRSATEGLFGNRRLVELASKIPVPGGFRRDG